jgi:hypothetical protein
LTNNLTGILTKDPITTNIGTAQMDAGSKQAIGTSFVFAGAAALPSVVAGIAEFSAGAGSAAMLDSFATTIGKALASKIGIGTTIVLGKYSSGIMNGYREMAAAVNAKVFSMPSAIYGVLNKLGIASKVNMAWLSNVASSGARILLNTDPNGKLSGAYADEINFLSSSGFKFFQVIENGIKCWEAIK